MSDDTELKRLQDLFRVLDKLVRSIPIYKGKGALVERLLDQGMEAVGRAVEASPVTLRVAPFGMLCGDTPVSPEDQKFPFVFKMFCDGIRELTFAPGVDREELLTLVGILGSPSFARDEDLVTLLWRADLPHVKFYAADTFAAGLEVDDQGDLVMRSDEIEQAPQGDAAGVEVAFTSEDLRRLKRGDALSWLNEVSAPRHAGAALAELAARVRSEFHTPRDHGRFIAIALTGDADAAAHPSELVLGMWDAALSDAQAEGIREMLRAATGRAREGHEGARALRRAMLSEERIPLLVPSIRGEPDLFFSLLLVDAQDIAPALVTLLMAFEAGDVQGALLERLEAEGIDLTPYHCERLRGGDGPTMLAAIEALEASRGPEAAAALSEALGANLSKVRNAALKALRGHTQHLDLAALGRVLRGPSSENRLLAAELLTSSAEPQATVILLDNFEELGAERAPAEQEAMLGCLARRSGEKVEQHFLKTLTERNVMRSKALVEKKLLYVKVLQENPGPLAHRVLTGFTPAWYHAAQVKDAVQAALKVVEARHGR